MGFMARDLFERAYHADNRHPLAAVNAATLARTEGEFRVWSVRVPPALDPNSGAAQVAFITDALRQGVEYDRTIIMLSHFYLDSNAVGQAAALLEVALDDPSGLSLDEEVQLHRMRAQALRALDHNAAMARETRQETFESNERLTLRPAIAEINRALTLDPYDAELWNFKSAWLTLLGDYDEALHCADKAISLRPRGYARPHQNKAAVMRAQRRWEEARQSANIARDIGLSHGYIGAAEVALADGFLQNLGPAVLDDRSIELHLLHVIRSARLTAQKLIDAAPRRAEEVAFGLSTRLMRVGPGWNGRCIPVFAAFLHDFIPEVCVEIALILSNRGQQSPKVMGDAALYIAMRGTGIIQRDAARFIAFRILWAKDTDDASEALRKIRQTYRTIILVPSAAMGPELAAAVGEQLRRISPLLFDAVAKQEPISEAEVAAAHRGLTERLSDAALGEPKPFSVHGGANVMGILAFAILLAVVALAWWLTH